MKAKWYLDVGVKEVWILLPNAREVLVVASAAILDEIRRSFGYSRVRRYVRRTCGRRSRTDCSPVESILA